jgi:AcrR family transcriptional regulator
MVRIDTRRMASTRSTSIKFERKRDIIVDAATRLLDQKGLGGMNLADVSSALNLLPTSLLYYFPNKEDLAVACFLKAIERYETFFTTAELGDTVEERLSLCLRSFFNFVLAVRTGTEAPLASFSDLRPLGNQEVFAAYNSMFRWARRVCFSRSHCNLDKPYRNARTHLLIQLMLWSKSWLTCCEPEHFPRATARLTDILANGIAAPSVRPLRFPSVIAMEADSGAKKSAQGAPLSREDFLQSATMLINDQGYVGASVERISAALNVTKGSFYHHLNTKDELVAACFHRSVDIILSAFLDAEANNERAIDILVSATSALVQRQLNGSSPILHMFALASVPASLRREALGRYDRVTYRIASLICDGVADGSIRPIDTNIAAHCVTSMINAAAELHLFAKDASPLNCADLFVRPLFTGLFDHDGHGGKALDS